MVGADGLESAFAAAQADALGGAEEAEVAEGQPDFQLCAVGGGPGLGQHVADLLGGDVLGPGLLNAGDPDGRELEGWAELEAGAVAPEGLHGVELVGDGLGGELGGALVELGAEGVEVLLVDGVGEAVAEGVDEAAEALGVVGLGVGAAILVVGIQEAAGELGDAEALAAGGWSASAAGAPGLPVGQGAGVGARGVEEGAFALGLVPRKVVVAAAPVGGVEAAGVGAEGGGSAAHGGEISGGGGRAGRECRYGRGFCRYGVGAWRRAGIKKPLHLQGFLNSPTRTRT